MLVYLDTCIAIYAVEGPPPLRQRAQAYIASLESRGHSFVISQLTRLECLVKPLGIGDGQMLLDFEAFFRSPNMRTIDLSAASFQRAAAIRAAGLYASGKKISLADSLHLAVALESGCSTLSTNDGRLKHTDGITIELLP